jgi:hypothetical protein
MAAADYALCDECGRKVFYDAYTDDIPADTVILHAKCAAKARREAAAEVLQQAALDLAEGDYLDWPCDGPAIAEWLGERAKAVTHAD